MLMRTGTLTLSLLLLSGCGEDAGIRGPDFLVRDEGGVALAENAGLHMADTLAWTIDTNAVVRIGLVEGPEEYVFGRLGGVLLTAEGQVLVADALTHDLRLFDEEGRFLRRIGREGEGPGEFGGITGLLRLAGDTIAVMSGQRVDLLDPSFEFMRRFRSHLTEMSVEPPYSSDKLEGLFADGAPLMSDFVRVCDTGGGEVCADSVLFHRTNESGDIVARFGRFVWGRQESYRVQSGFSVSIGEPHPQAFWTVRGDRFYYADAQRFEIRVYRPDGGLERRIRVNEEASHFPREEVFQPIPQSDPSGDPMLNRMREELDAARRSAELPDTFPSFSDLMVDEEDNIWVREYRPNPQSQPSPRWWIFDPEGRLRWAVRSPPGLEHAGRALRRAVRYIGSDRIVASVRNEYDVETVVVYRMQKN
jgi:hypothetical protein